MNYLIDNTDTPATLIRNIEIDWPRLIERRPITLAHSAELPKYLLLPEIHALLDNTLDANEHLMMNTLWYTGARVSEMLALRPSDFHLNKDDSFVSIASLKKRLGRRKKGHHSAARRMVPITDPSYLWELESYIKTNRIKRNERLFNFTRQAADYRIKNAVKRVNESGRYFDISVSAKTFRHSFAVNAVLHFQTTATLQQWLGHEDRETTEIYTQVLSGDTSHQMKQVKFR